MMTPTRMMLLTEAVLFASCFMLTPANTCAADSQFTMIIGIDYAEQDYESGEKAEVLTVPLIVKYEIDK